MNALQSSSASQFSSASPLPEISNQSKDSPNSEPSPAKDFIKKLKKLKKLPISAAAKLEDFRSRLQIALNSYFGKNATRADDEKSLSETLITTCSEERLYSLLSTATTPSFYSDMRKVVIEEVEVKSRYSITESIPYGKSNLPTYLFLKAKNSPKAVLLKGSDKCSSDLPDILAKIEYLENYDDTKIQDPRSLSKIIKDRINSHPLVKNELAIQNNLERLTFELHGLFRSNNDEISFVNSLKGALKKAFKEFGIKENDPEVTLIQSPNENKNVDLDKVHRQFNIKKNQEKNYTYSVSVIYPPINYKRPVRMTSVAIENNDKKGYKKILDFSSIGIRENLRPIVSRLFPEQEAKIQAKKRAEIAKLKNQIKIGKEAEKKLRNLEENPFQLPVFDFDSSETDSVNEEDSSN